MSDLNKHPNNFFDNLENTKTILYNTVIERQIKSLNEKKLLQAMQFEISQFPKDSQMDTQHTMYFGRYEKKILNFPEVVECWLMTGAKDYLIRIAVKNVKEFEDFLTKKLTVIDGVSSVETSIPLRRVKSEYSRVE